MHKRKKRAAKKISIATGLGEKTGKLTKKNIKYTRKCGKTGLGLLQENSAKLIKNHGRAKEKSGSIHMATVSTSSGVTSMTSASGVMRVRGVSPTFAVSVSTGFPIGFSAVIAIVLVC